MLEITVLKTLHEGQKEARKLVEHIQACDVYSSETYGLSDKYATTLEGRWLDLLAPGIKRTKARQAIQQFTSSFDVRSHRDYAQTELDYVWRNGKPLFFIERFLEGDSELQEVNALIGRGQEMTYEGARLIKGEPGNTEIGAKHWYEGMKMMLQAVDRRDQRIARSLSEAEPKLRVLTSELGVRDPIRLTINIGGAHRFERYLELPVEVIDLHPGKDEDERSYLVREIYNLIDQDIPLSDLIPLIVRCAELSV